MLHKALISPLLDRLDSETWHKRAVEFLHLAEASPIRRRLLELMACGGKRCADPRLETPLGSLTLENPLLVGAGWDKQGRALLGEQYSYRSSAGRLRFVLSNPARPALVHAAL